MLKNILYITVRSDIGGGQEHIYSLLKNIDRKIYSPYIACPKIGYYARKFAEMSVGQLEIPFRKFSVYRMIKMCNYIRDNRISLIHSHGRGAGIYGRLAGMFMRVPVVHTYHGIHYSNGIMLTGGVYKIVEKFLSKMTKVHIHVSASEEKKALAVNIHEKQSSRIIYNGIDHSKYIFSEKSRKEIRKEFGVDENTLLVGTVARFDKVKNIEKSLEIVEKLSVNCPVKFVLVGDGEQKKHIENSAARYPLNKIVKITGFRNDISDILSGLDVYLSVSKNEGLPYSIIEAMAVGVPVVASDVPGNNEVIINGKSGFLVQLNDTDGFVKTILDLYSNPYLRKYISQNAIDRSKEAFDVKNMVEKTQQIYEGIFQGEDCL